MNGTALLPCLFCVATNEGRDTEEWETVKVDWNHAANMSTRFRQHLFRVHDLRSRDPRAERMKCRARSVLCQLLHDRPGETSSDQVCWWQSSYFLASLLNFSLF